MAVPFKVTGDVMEAFQVGSVRAMAADPAPRTHHELSEPSSLTKTVVTGPVALGWTDISPERASPCWNWPITGWTMWRKSVANPVAAASGVR